MTIMGAIKTNRFQKILAIGIVLLAVFWSLFVYAKGVIITIDTIRLYSPFADVLIRYNFNVFAYLENVEMRTNPLLYFNWVSIIAFSKLLIGENWGVGIVVLNLLAGISVAILLLRVTWAITGKRACAIFSGVALVFCYDFLQWIPVVLSDILFAAICFAVFFNIMMICHQSTEFKKRVIGILILACIAMFFRPTSPPLLVFVSVFLPLLFFVDLKEVDSGKRRSFILWLALFGCLAAPVILFSHSYLMMHPNSWPFALFKDWIYFDADNYRKGMVVYGYLDTYHFPPSSILEYSLISIHKMVAFFYFDTKFYSTGHTIINYIFFLPVYGLSVFALIQLFKKEEGPAPSNWWSIFLCGAFIALFDLFHAFNLVDFDYRYRVPCMLPLIFLASLGLNELVRSLPRKISSI